MPVINKISELIIKIKDGFGNNITSTDLGAGKRAIDVNISGGASQLQVGNLVGDGIIQVTNGNGSVLNSEVNLSIQNGSADGATKGAVTFNPNDFNDNLAGLISLDYTNGQKASATLSGFLSSTDWNTFNNKAEVPTRGNLTAFSPLNVTNGLNAVFGSGTSITIDSATTSIKGAVQLSNNYTGSSQILATTEKALSDGLATKQNIITPRDLVAESNKISLHNGVGSLIGANDVGIDINEANLVHQNIGGAGTNTHANIDSHIASISNPHSVTKTQVGLSNVTNDAQMKKISSSTIGNIPIWNSATGDLLADGYGIETILVGGTSNLARADAIKTYVDNAVAASDAMVYKGIINCSGNPNYPAANCGWSYKVSVAGKIGGAGGPNVEVGDMLICLLDNSPSGDHGTVGANWNILQNNIDGAVIGPSSSINNRIATFNGTTGKLIADSGYAAQDASTSQKGFIQLSNLYNGTSQILATTEKALSDGLATKENNLTKGNLTAASNKITIGGTGTDAVIGTGVSVDVNEANLSLNNISGTLGIAKGGTGQITANTALNALLPSQSGQANKVLQTDGTNTSWQPQSGGSTINNKCRARQTVVQSIASRTWVKLQLNTEDFDVANEFDNDTNYRYTATVAGYYQVNGSYILASSATSCLVRCGIYKNGTLYAVGPGYKILSRLGSGAHVSDIVYLAVGDYVELYCWHNAPSSRNTEISAGYESKLSIHRLS